MFRARGSIPAGRGPPRASDPSSQAKKAFAKRRGVSVEKISVSDWDAECETIAAAGTGAIPEVGRYAAAEPESEVVRSCWVCLEEYGELLRGCACRGTAGWAHVDCLAKFAFSRASNSDKLDAWRQCVTCRQHFVGHLLLGMARAHGAMANDKTQLPTAEQCTRDMFLAQGLFNSEKKADLIEAIRLGEMTLCLEKRRRIPFGHVSLGRGASNMLPGDLHPNCISHIQNLANFYQKITYHHDIASVERTRYHARQLSLMEEAVASHRTFEQLLPAVVKGLGMNLGHTMESLAFAYDSAGRSHEARSSFEKGLEINRRTLGDDAVATLTCASNLGLFLKKKGDLTAALLSLMRDAYPRLRRVLGGTAPMTLYSSTRAILRGRASYKAVGASPRRAGRRRCHYWLRCWRPAAAHGAT